MNDQLPAVLVSGRFLLDVATNVVRCPIDPSDQGTTYITGKNSFRFTLAIIVERIKIRGVNCFFYTMAVPALKVFRYLELGKLRLVSNGVTGIAYLLTDSTGAEEKRNDNDVS